MSFPPSYNLFLICATTIFCCFLCCCRGSNNETDHLALLQIKARITHDPLGVMSSWTDTNPFCQWHGVTCGHQHSRVIALHLNSSKLAGILSPFVGNLSFLREFSLSDNSTSGLIPPEISNLHRLQYLALFNNSFGGEILSNISGCFNLIKLALHSNSLVGMIPSGVGSLSALNYLSLNDNKLTGIPPSLGNLTSLSRLYIFENHLVGTIPESLGKLEKLTILSLFNNRLSGAVPSIFNLSLLVGLDLSQNHLEGSLPSDFGTTLSRLQAFSIAENRFTGSIPISISNSSDLSLLELYSNRLQGEVPSLYKLDRLVRFLVADNSLGTGQATDLNFVSSLVNATMLVDIDIQQNNFKGTFPSIICNFSTLSILNLGGNNINGHIPACIENLVFLRMFGVAYNQLSGFIPPSIVKLNRLNFLSLSYNQLSGNIPPDIGNLTQLSSLVLFNNNLEGNIPPSLGNCSYLLQLYLSHNKLNGSIPPELLRLSSLSIVLDLSNNPLTGSLPREVGALKNLDMLAVCNTKLSGEIPSTIGACTSLEYIYMGGNSFHGSIPQTFIALRGLLWLDLSLSGEIPGFLASLPLKWLNLSYNNFQGEVPIGGVFSNATGYSISGNRGLCGGIPELKLPACNSSKNHGKETHHRWRLMVALLWGFAGVVLLVGFIALSAFFYRKKIKETATKSEMNSLPNLPYQTLLKATNGFSSENLIGRGTFGVVYKGKLDEDQSVVAVKVFNLEHRAATKSFLAECQVLRNVRHRNLVKVITACSSVDNQRKDFKALVYEYMANGSLEDWLHDRSSDAPRKLNLLGRLDAAVDVAFALEYLHNYTSASIIRCDLKPSNVLFDDEMVAHVGDFGLAEFLSNGTTSSGANQSSSVGVRGTIGYAPSEYGMGNEPSTYGDVYSFGVLLMEMLTGKRPTDSLFKDGFNLHGFVKAAFPDNVMEVLDSALVEDIAREETSARDDVALWSKRGHSMVILEALTSVLGIALSCSAELPQERLGMSDVAAKLSSIRNKLVGTHLQRQSEGVNVFLNYCFVVKSYPSSVTPEIVTILMSVTKITHEFSHCSMCKYEDGGFE